ncbi:MAG: hypothetical protein P8Y85_00545 [Nitrospirota bacterium]
MRHQFLAIVMAMSLVLSATVILSCKQKAEAPKEGEVTTEDVKKDVGEAVGTTKAYLAEQKEEFTKDMEAKLADYGSRIDELQKKADEATGDVKAKMDEQMKNLRNKQEAAQKKLDEIEESSGKAWEDLKAGADRTMEDLKKSYEDAKSQFEK